MNDKTPKILEHVRNKIENSDDNIKHIIEQQANNYVLFWKKTVRGIGLLSLIVLVVGICQTATMLFVAPTPEALQPSPTILVAQTTDKPATITDNEIKNTANQTADRHNYTMLAENSTATLPTADAPQPDIMATTPVAQEPVSVLLAEAEIQLEQNYTAIDNTNTLSTDTILQLQTDLPKYETSYLAYIDIQSYNAGNRIYFCNSDCTNKYMEEAVCEMINGI